MFQTKKWGITYRSASSYADFPALKPACMALEACLHGPADPMDMAWFLDYDDLPRAVSSIRKPKLE
jgi:hypothetical protein